MSELNQHKSYSEAEIRKYLAGQLSASEMHAIEKAALDDPFLADAIEGIQEADNNYGQPIVETKLQAAKDLLKERLQEEETGKVIPLFWKRFAVAAVLLIVAGTWLYNSLTQSDKTDNALAIDDRKKSEIVADSAPRLTDTVIESKVSDFVTADSNTNQTKLPAASERKEQFAKIDVKKSNTPELAPTNTPTTSASKQEAAAPKSIQEAEDKLKATDDVDRDVSKKSTETNAPKTEQQAGSVKAISPIIVKVVDANNTPISSATVVDLDKKQTYLTDQAGNVKLLSDDTAINASISSVGFETKKLRLSATQDINRVQLGFNANLSETVVVGYGNKDNRSKEKTIQNRRAPKVMVQDAEPIVGWVDYNTYLDSAKAAVKSSVSGDVVVSFVVNKEGERSSYRIEQSLNKEQDEAALAIVKAGPTWRLLKGKKQRVYVILRF